ncbi:MAG: amidohydrolase [Dehalococcoidia bacterium]|nr:amidohydrolase [Dehalococcoidia bacterium]
MAANKDVLKHRVADEIDQHAEELVRLAQTVLRHPEPGFREVKTSALVQETLQSWSISVQNNIAITGLRATLNGGEPGPTVAILGELDSLIVPGHPYADAVTNAAHACGHHAQIGMLLSVARGLLATGVLRALAGRVVLLAVPAEEYIEVAFREGLRQAGRIEFLGGKPELIRLGQFDDVDIAMLTHTTSGTEHKKLALGTTNNGVLAKQVQFIGKAAHAGGAPWNGVNALNAAMISLTALNSLREAFPERDTVRIHPIITKGGDAVNSVPADVRMELFVRARTLDALFAVTEKVDRCLRAGALATGCKVKISTYPGYLPMLNDPALSNVYRANAAVLVGEESVGLVRHRGSSTDMGDVSHLLPALHPYAGGAKGEAHGPNYLIEDWENTVLTASKAMAFTIIDLLGDGAQQAREVKAKHRPRMTKEEYLSTMRGLFQERVFTE